MSEFDIPVDDLEVVTMTRIEFDAQIERAKTEARNAAWAEARKKFPRATVDELAARITKLEQLVETALGVLIPTLNSKQETRSNGT